MPNQDVIRVHDLEANLPTVLRAGMIGFGSDTFRMAHKNEAGGSMRYYSDDSKQVLLADPQTITGVKTISESVKLLFRNANAWINSPSSGALDIKSTGTITLGDESEDDQLIRIKAGQNQWISMSHALADNEIIVGESSGSMSMGVDTEDFYIFADSGLHLDGGGASLQLSSGTVYDFDSFSDVDMTAIKTLLLAASTVSNSTINIPHGTAPSSPADGDMWTTTAGLYVRINGGTVGPLT